MRFEPTVFCMLISLDGIRIRSNMFLFLEFQVCKLTNMPCLRIQNPFIIKEKKSRRQRKVTELQVQLVYLTSTHYFECDNCYCLQTNSNMCIL